MRSLVFLCVSCFLSALSASNAFILVSSKEGQVDLFRVDLDTDHWTQLTKDTAVEKYPKMDAKGRILFIQAVDNRDQCFSLDATGVKKQLTQPEAGFQIMEPSFHPDGKHFFYNRISDGLAEGKASGLSAEIWIAKLDGSEAKRLIGAPGLYFNPVAFGKQLLTVANEFDGFEEHPLSLYSFDLEGQKRVKRTNGFEAYGSWLDETHLLAVHIEGFGDDKKPGPYMIEIGGENPKFQALGSPDWGDSARFPNADPTGRYVLLTARVQPVPEGDNAWRFKGCQAFLIDLKDGTWKAFGKAEDGAEGAWLIP